MKEISRRTFIKGAAASALSDAIAALVVKPVLDYTALDAAIAQAEDTDTSLYTSATVAAMQAALADARAARADAELQNEVDSATEALEEQRTRPGTHLTRDRCWKRSRSFRSWRFR